MNIRTNIDFNYDLVTKELFKGSLPEFQRKPLELFLEEYGRRQSVGEDITKEQLAYILATAFHESGRFRFDQEIGKGNGRDYGSKLLLIRGKQEQYYGRGWVQITWLTNYAKLSVAATLAFKKEIDFVNEPDLIFKNQKYNTFVIFEGMLKGIFTSKKVSDYINTEVTDFRGARLVVNGKDKAETIAVYAESFLKAME